MEIKELSPPTDKLVRYIISQIIPDRKKTSFADLKFIKELENINGIEDLCKR